MVLAVESDSSRARALANLRRDLGFAIRQLRRSPGFALMTVLTLALGIGAAAGIRILGGMLYGIAAWGAGELTLVAMALLIGAVAAAWAPAWRAASIDPMRVLREE